MTIKFFNSLSRSKEIFKPLTDNEVRIYSCGPTVYNFVHIGNLRAYVFVDLLRRYLKYKGFKIHHVMNITDIDDKIIQNSKATGKSLNEFTSFYANAFIEDLKKLNIEIPEIMPKATDSIYEMVELVKILKDKGFAYEKNGTWYFKINNFRDYGALAHINMNEFKTNWDGRLTNEDIYEKDDVRDFALWKAYSAEDKDIFWNTEIGKGRPGWHLECSAMSIKYLGQPFDIHTGGVDLIFPHHTNEIAQSEAAFGKKFVNLWLHNEHLLVNGEKMSKSLGNFFTLRDLLAKGHNPKTIRYQLLSVHYRQQLNFTEEALISMASTLQRIYDFIDRLNNKGDESLSGGNNISPAMQEAIKQATAEFESCLDDDLNISGALGAMFTFMRTTNKLMDSENIGPDGIKAAKDLIDCFDGVLGICSREKDLIPPEIMSMIEERYAAKKTKDFAKADAIRDRIKSLGFILEDTPNGTTVKPIS